MAGVICSSCDCLPRAERGSEGEERKYMRLEEGPLGKKEVSRKR